MSPAGRLAVTTSAYSVGLSAVSAVSATASTRITTSSPTTSASRRSSAAPAVLACGHVTLEKPIARIDARSFAVGVPAGVPRYQIETAGAGGGAVRAMAVVPAIVTTKAAVRRFTTTILRLNHGLDLPEMMFGVARDSDEEVLDVDLALFGVPEAKTAIDRRERSAKARFIRRDPSKAAYAVWPSTMRPRAA